MALNPYFSLFGQATAGCLSHLNNSNRNYDTNEGKIVLEELHKLWKHHTNHLKERYQRNEHKDAPPTTITPSFKLTNWS